MKHAKKTHAAGAPPPSAVPEGAAPPPSPGGEEALAEAARKLAELDDLHLRLRADFDNYRKRMARDRDETVRRTREEMLHDLLPVIDSLERSLAAAMARGVEEVFVEGQRLLLDQFFRSAEKYGLKKVESVGKPFDPLRQEAIQHVASEEYPSGTVMSESRSGYLAGDRLLRPAQVIVSSGSAAPPGDNGADGRKKENRGGGEA